MNRILSGAAGVSLLTLGACSGQPATTTAQTVPQAAATISAAVLPSADLAKVESICARNSGLLAAATSPVAPKIVSDTASYAASYCSQLTASAQVGQVPATTNSNTPTWLPTAFAAVEDVAKAAAFILPLVL